jgi:GT2 family glycosyltransferase
MHPVSATSLQRGERDRPENRGSTPTVSIIVPTRNRSAMLAQALRCALGQRSVDVEVIVVDEASTDDTPRMLASIRDPRLRVLRHDPPKGVSTARNLAVDAARGEWLAFLDDDDLWAADKLACQLDAASRTGTDWAYAGAVVIDLQGRILRGGPPPDPLTVVDLLPRYDVIPGGGSNVIMKRALWARTGGFDPRLRNTEDWELWLRLSKQGPPACAAMPLVARRLHGANSTLDVAEIVRGISLIQQMHHTDPDWAVLHRWLAFSCLRAGLPGQALRQFGKAAWHGKASTIALDVFTWIKARLGASQQPPAIDGDPWLSAASAWLVGATSNATSAYGSSGDQP